MKIPTQRILVPAVAGAAILTAVGAGLATRVFNRPSESAMALVPRDAEAVAVVDLTPGFHQLGAFRKLMSSADAVKLGENLDRLSRQWLGDYAWVRELAPTLNRSAILVVMPETERRFYRPWNQPARLVILPLSNPALADQVLRKHLTFADGEFSAPRSKEKACIMGDALVLWEKQEDIDAVRECALGKGASFTSQDDYQSARRAIDADANLKVFVASSAYRSRARNASSGLRELADAPGWFAAGLAIRDNGLAFSCSVPVDAKKWEPYKRLASMVPIRKDLLAHLPAGAYGVAALSQPGVAWQFVRDACAGDEWTLRSFRDGEETLRREADIDIEEAINSVGKGTAVCAVYPSSTKPLDGIDGLVVFDDANGAKPADLVERVRRYSERMLGDNRDGGRIFEPLDLEKTSAYTLARSVRLRQEDQNLNFNSEFSRKLIHGKTVAYATEGNAVLIATSEDLLDRAVKAYRGEGDTLNSDDQLASPASFGDDGPQAFAAINLKSLVEAVETEAPWSEAPTQFRSLLKSAVKPLEQLSSAAMISVRAGADAASIKAFIPLDFDALGDFGKSAQPDFDKFMAEKALEMRERDVYSQVYALESQRKSYQNSHNGEFFPPGSDEQIAAQLTRDNPTVVNREKVAWTFNPALRGAKSGWLDSTQTGQIPVFYGAPAWDSDHVFVVRADGFAMRPLKNEWIRVYAPNTIAGMFHAPVVAAPTPVTSPPPVTAPVGGVLTTMPEMTFTIPAGWGQTSPPTQRELAHYEYANPALNLRFIVESGGRPTSLTSSATEFNVAFLKKAPGNGYQNQGMGYASVGGANAYCWQFIKDIPSMHGPRYRRILYFNTAHGHGSIIEECLPGAWGAAKPYFDAIESSLHITTH